MVKAKRLQNEAVPDLVKEEVMTKASVSPIKKKRSVPAVKSKTSGSTSPRLPANFEKMVAEHRIKDGTPLGWDARITDYYLNDADIKEIRQEKDDEGKPVFTETHGGRVVHTIKGFKVAEIGALRVKDRRNIETTRRIVKVTPIK